MVPTIDILILVDLKVFAACHTSLQECETRHINRHNYAYDLDRYCSKGKTFATYLYLVNQIAELDLGAKKFIL
jgi:hypothetical protein